MGEADPNGDLNFMSGPHGNKCGRQRELLPGPGVGWSRGALGRFLILAAAEIMEGKEKTYAGRTGVHRRM